MPATEQDLRLALAGKAAARAAQQAAQQTAAKRADPAPRRETAAVLRTDVSRAMLLGGIGSLVLLLAILVWAQITPINGAVIASGQVTVRGQAKTVQSLDGGIVDAILVADGDKVVAGQPLIRLDPTLLQVNLEIYRNRLAEALARKARLQAEQLDLPAPVFGPPSPLLDGMDLGLQYESQRQMFTARADVLRGTRDQLRETIVQFRNQAIGVDGQIAALRDQLGFIETDLANAVTLNAKGLVRESQVLDLQRSRSAMLGQIAEQQATRARIANSVRDTELAILQAEREFKEQVVTDLREATTASEELTLQIVTTQKQLDRIVLHAPSAGVVHELQATTLGGVVAPGATVVQIVPLSDGVEFSLRLDPSAIDEVYVGQKAKVVLPAFSRTTTPEIFGTLATISPTSITDPATGQSFYRLTLGIPPEELARLSAVELVPGMPVEAFLQTGERSVWSYLTKPLSDQMARAFREN